MIEPLQIAGLTPPSSPEPEFQFYNTAFDLADSTIPTVPNAGTPSPPNADTTNFGQPSTGAADLLGSPNSQGLPVQNFDTNTGKTTGDFFKQAPAGTNGNPNLYQKITLPVDNQPVDNQPVENQDFRPAPAQQESPSFEVPIY